MQKNSIKKVIIVGHIGNKPEGRYTPSGTSTASFSIATNEAWIDLDKEKQEKTEWHNIIAWNKLADFATEYLNKGQLVYIEGKLQTRSYNDKDGIKKWITEIICTSITPLEWKSRNNIGTKEATKDNQSSKGKLSDDNNSIPF